MIAVVNGTWAWELREEGKVVAAIPSGVEADRLAVRINDLEKEVARLKHLQEIDDEIFDGVSDQFQENRKRISHLEEFALWVTRTAPDGRINPWAGKAAKRAKAVLHNRPTQRHGR